MLNFSYFQFAHLDGDLCIFVRQFEGVREHLEVLFEGEGGPGQLLLVTVDVVVQADRLVNEHQLAAAL